mgnify:CR=1 FL=1
MGSINEHIIRDFSVGQEKAFRILYEKYAPALRYFAAKYVEEGEVIDDIVQDVFVCLWEKRVDFKTEETIKAFLYKAVKNSCLNFLKHQEYEWNYAEIIRKKTPVYETESDSVYTLDELYRMLYETLNKLPDNYRTVFIESFFKGKTHTEIAEELNLSVKSVNRYKQRTIELLRNELKDYLPLLLLFIASGRA